MTREEMEELKGLAASMGLYDDKKPCKRAMILGKAIRALEQEPCEDCISRAEAIKVLEYEVSIEAGGGLDKYKTVIQGLLNAIYSAQKKAIEELPSIQSKPKTGHWIKTPKAVMGEGYMWYCDNCEHQVYQDSSEPYPSEKYCPDCGYRMIRPQESEG